MTTVPASTYTPRAERPSAPTLADRAMAAAQALAVALLAIGALTADVTLTTALVLSTVVAAPYATGTPLPWKRPPGRHSRPCHAQPRRTDGWAYVALRRATRG